MLRGQKANLVVCKNGGLYADSVKSFPVIVRRRVRAVGNGSTADFHSNAIEGRDNAVQRGPLQSLLHVCFTLCIIFC
jgi:hypothetical protein